MSYGFIILRYEHESESLFQTREILIRRSLIALRIIFERSERCRLWLRETIGMYACFEQDLTYVCKKLGFSSEEFAQYLATPPVSHYAYPSYARLAEKLVAIHKRKRYG